MLESSSRDSKGSRGRKVQQGGALGKEAVLTPVFPRSVPRRRELVGGARVAAANLLSSETHPKGVRHSLQDRQAPRRVISDQGSSSPRSLRLGAGRIRTRRRQGLGRKLHRRAAMLLIPCKRRRSRHLVPRLQAPVRQA